MKTLDEVRSKCSAALRATRDTEQIAAKLSEGRVRVVSRRGGIGDVLLALGAVEGPKLLDKLDTLKVTNATVRWIWPLIERGELDFGSPVVREMIAALETSLVLTKPVADALRALGEQPDPVSEFDVRKACWSDAGEWLA